VYFPAGAPQKKRHRGKILYPVPFTPMPLRNGNTRRRTKILPHLSEKGYGKSQSRWGARGGQSPPLFPCQAVQCYVSQDDLGVKPMRRVTGFDGNARLR